MDKKRKEELTEEHVGLVHLITHQFDNTKLEYEERFATAMVGFAKALNSFDEERGIKFTTYAGECMRREILYFLRKGRKWENNISMDCSVSTDKHGNQLKVEDTVADDNSIEEEYLKNEEYKELHEALNMLDERSKKAVTLYYFNKMSQRDIGEILNISQASISKIILNAMPKLKKILEGRTEAQFSRSLNKRKAC